MRLNAISETKDRIEKDSFRMKQEMAEEKQKSDLKLQELNNANEHLSKMSQIFNSKNAQLSLFRLNEERLILDNNKYQKEYKKMQESVAIQGEKFESIKSTLKDVLERDNDFCKNNFDTLTSMSDDSQMCDVVKFLILDYVETKIRHKTDLQNTNEQLKSYAEKIGSYKKTILDLVRKIKSQTEAFKNKEQMKEMEDKKQEKEFEKLKASNAELGKKIQGKDDRIKELAASIPKSKAKEGKEQKLIETIQQLKLKESIYLNDISALKKEMLMLKNKIKADKMAVDKIKVESSPAVGSKTIEQLKSEMAKNEAEYYESLQKYITNLDGMKKQVNIMHSCFNYHV